MLTERVNLKKLCKALLMKHPLITSINALLKTEEKTFIGLYRWQTEAITAESGGGGDERGDNNEELRKLGVRRGDREVRQPNTALRTNQICEEEEE